MLGSASPKQLDFCAQDRFIWNALTRNAHDSFKERHHESITEARERRKAAATVSEKAETGQLTCLSSLPAFMLFQNWTPQPPESPQQMRVQSSTIIVGNDGLSRRLNSLPTEHCYSSAGLNNGSAQRISITTFLF